MGAKMKRLFLLVFLLAGRLFASELSIFLDPRISYNNQHISYAVVDTDGSINSRLDWDAEYLFSAGTAISFLYGNWDICASVDFNLPFECGQLTDSDWRTKGLKTNLSRHELKSGFGFDAAVSLGYRFVLPESFILAPVFSVQNSFDTQKAQKTTGWCGDTNHTNLSYDVSWDDAQAVRVKKYGIDFYINAASVFFGLNFQKQISRFSMEFTGQFSPFTYVFAVDHHLNKEEGHYYQLIQKAIMYKLEAACAYTLTDDFSLKLSAAWLSCPKTSGDFYFGWFGTDHIIADETSTLSFSKLNITIFWQKKIK